VIIEWRNERRGVFWETLEHSLRRTLRWLRIAAKKFEPVDSESELDRYEFLF
jgi:hypothetical protein